MVEGWHAPAGRRTREPRPLPRLGRSDRHRRWMPGLGPGRQAAGKTARAASAESEVRPGPRPRHYAQAAAKPQKQGACRSFSDHPCRYGGESGRSSPSVHRSRKESSALRGAAGPALAPGSALGGPPGASRAPSASARGIKAAHPVTRAQPPLPAGHAGYGRVAAIGTSACQLIVVTAGATAAVRPQVSLHVRLSGTDHECRGGAEAGLRRPPPVFF